MPWVIFDSDHIGNLVTRKKFGILVIVSVFIPLSIYSRTKIATYKVQNSGQRNVIFATSVDWRDLEVRPEGRVVREGGDVSNIGATPQTDRPAKMDHLSALHPSRNPIHILLHDDVIRWKLKVRNVADIK